MSPKHQIPVVNFNPFVHKTDRENWWPLILLLCLQIVLHRLRDRIPPQLFFHYVAATITRVQYIQIEGHQVAHQ